MIKLDKLFMLLLVAFLVAMVTYKAVFVEKFIFGYTGVRYAGALSVMKHDAIVCCSIFILVMISCLRGLPALPRCALRCAAWLIFAVYSLDLVILKVFNTHLVFADIYKYSTYSFKYLRQTHGSKIILLLTLAALAVKPFAASLIYKVEASVRTVISVVLLFLIIAATAHIKDGGSYAHSWVYQNFFEYNSTIMSERARYSDEFVARMHRTDDGRVYVDHSPEPRNVIVLVVESLSSYQSKLFSGLQDWTPNLDRIARRNVYFTRFYANGFTTEDGEISILTGKFPLQPPAGYTDGGGSSFFGFSDPDGTLPSVFKSRGYRAEFYTSEDLEFGKTGKWARTIGFDHVEGCESPFYDGWPRFQFNAPPDEALLLRVLARVKEEKTVPSFLVVKTVSSHHPFKNPDNGRMSEQETFKYVDRQIGAFYDGLVKLKYFENGVLVIVGDHHAMVPLRSEEIQKYGVDRAVATIPMIYVDGKDKAREIRQQFQQIDIHNSLCNLVSSKECTSPWNGSFTGRVVPAQYVIHRRGDERNTVSVFAQEGEVRVRLDGDHTRIVATSGLEPLGGAALINKINSLRMSVHR